MSVTPTHSHDAKCTRRMLRVQVVLLMACCATSNAQKLMDMFDKNKDGKVTKKEFMDVSRMVSSLAKSKD